MINHAQLAQWLSNPTRRIEQDLQTGILLLTAGGVIREGGPLARDVKPSDPVDSVFRSDLPMQATASASVKPIVRDSGFKLGAASLKELEGVDSLLVSVVKLAITITEQDFTVYDGIRTVKEQMTHVKNGTSKTMQSKHLDGLAVDLVPWVNGKPVWDWKRIYPIAFAMDRAATLLGFADLITWGGAWDRKLSDFGGSPEAYKRETELYADRHPGKDFLDGPHFEILKA